MSTHGLPGPPEAPAPRDLVAIAAVARNGVIGSGLTIPWRLPEDLRRFKRLTTGHVLVMGRRTYDSIGRPLPGRTTLVLTHDPTWRADGVRAVPSVSAALALAAKLTPGPVFVAGGGEVYRAAWDDLTALEITEVHRAVAGDVTFPTIDPSRWVETARDSRDGFGFISYRRWVPRG